MVSHLKNGYPVDVELGCPEMQPFIVCAKDLCEVLKWRGLRPGKAGSNVFNAQPENTTDNFADASQTQCMACLMMTGYVQITFSFLSAATPVTGPSETLFVFNPHAIHFGP